MSSSRTKESKRQQARNERTLQDLIKGIPGNDTCADCGARNPAWASWSLGIFLCMRCAAIHRKLGTHISKVKSLSMDSWTAEQVETMRRMGNKASNQKYNPKNKQPPVPIDADEADSAMERFIREKYANAGSTSTGTNDEVGGNGSGRERRSRMDSHSSEDPPPTLPPKSTSKFSFRSASSIFPMSSKSKKEREAAARTHLEEEARAKGGGQDDRRRMERADDMSPDKMEENLIVLRDMGFKDEKKNKTILKGLNGNLQKTIDTLVRLGENSGPSSRSRTPQQESGPSAGLSSTAGLSINRSGQKNNGPSNNPWDISTPAPPQTAQSTGDMLKSQSTNNPFDAPDRPSTNPFGLQPSQSHMALNQQYQLADQFSNMSVSQPQPLFPNRTGGAPGQQPFQRSAAPPMPSIPQGYQSFYDSQSPLPQAPQAQNFNPFFQQQQSQMQPQPQAAPQPNPSSNPYAQRANTYPLANEQQAIYEQPSQPQQQQDLFYGQNQRQQSTNPFGLSSPSQQQQPQNQNSNPFGAPQQHFQQYQQSPPAQPQQQMNPWATQTQQQQQQQPYSQTPIQQYNQPQFQPQQQQQAILPQQTGRNKNDILALYNFPDLAPPNSQLQSITQSPSDMRNQTTSYFQTNTSHQQQQQQHQQAYVGGSAPAQQQQHQQQGQQVRSVSSPLAGYGSTNHNNPFMNSAAVAMNGDGVFQVQNGGTQGHGHMSHESISMGGGGWGGQNGRHSPDAFASLSARSMR